MSDAGDRDDEDRGEDGPVFEREAVFDPDRYLQFYADRVAPERSAEEAAFLADALDVGPGDRVLDVPCGHGRHAVELADRGIEVLGLDREAGFLRRARSASGDRGRSAEAKAGEDPGAVGPPGFVRGDMRELPFGEDVADAAYNVFTSFGYFGEAGNRRTLAELVRVVRPGGRVLVDVVDRDALLHDFESVTTAEVDGDLMVDRHEYDPRTGRVRTRRLTVRDGDAERATYSVRTYPYTELTDRFEAAGLRPVAAHGSLDGEEYGLEAGRLVLVGVVEG